MRAATARVLGAALLFATACSSESDDTRPGAQPSTVASCIESYPTSEYAYGEPSGVAVAPPPGVDAGPPPPRPPPELAASAACTSAGAEGPTEASACDVERFMSVAAALCIARAHGMAEGLTGLRGSLVYNYRHRRVIYSVENTLHEETDRAEGDVWSIDAITGEILAKQSWGSIS